LPTSTEILRQRALEKFAHAWAQVDRQVTEVGFGFQNGSYDFRYRIAFERRPGREHFIEDAAEREHITALIGRKTLGLLRRHISRGPKNHSGIRTGADECRGIRQGRIRHFALECLRESEIENLDLAVRRNLDVGGLQVAVNDPSFMRGLEAFADLLRDCE
jgi:hypothetical protein